MPQSFVEFPALTGLRGIAALWVLLFHLWALCGEPLLNVGAGNIQLPVHAFFSVGWVGVDIFFTLSAFLLALPFAAWQLHVAPRPPLTRYFLRRVLRIFPAYYAQLAILLLLALMFGIGRSLDLHDLLAHLVLWLLLGDNPVMPLNGVWFTLPIEFAFYLSLPFLALLLKPRWWIVLLLGAVLLAISYRWYAYLSVASAPVPQRVNVIERFPGRLDQFVIGMLSAYLFVAIGSGKQRVLRMSNALIFWIGSIGLMTMCAWIFGVGRQYWDGHPLLFFWHTLTSVALGLIIFSAARGTALTQRLLANRILHYLGEVSFGIYLWHIPILLWLQPFVPTTWSGAERMLGVGIPLMVLTVLAAHLSYVLIERPALRWGRPHSAQPALETELPQIV